MICPKCLNELHRKNNTYKCLNNHSYDLSKEGYLNLLLSKTNSGDNKELINGRINFLDKDFYLPLAKKIIQIYQNYFNNQQFKLCDCGCGTGYYSKQIQNDLENITLFGTDISKEAIKYAAKKNKKSLFIVASNQKIPFENCFFDALLYVFSPFFEDEARRIIKNNGFLIIISPGIEHLYELKQQLYSNPYYNKIEDENFKHFQKIVTHNLKYKIDVNLDDFKQLIKMTPYYYKTRKSDIENISFEGTLSITIDFLISVFSPVISQA